MWPNPMALHFTVNTLKNANRSIRKAIKASKAPTPAAVEDRSNRSELWRGRKGKGKGKGSKGRSRGRKMFRSIRGSFKGGGKRPRRRGNARLTEDDWPEDYDYDYDYDEENQNEEDNQEEGTANSTKSKGKGKPGKKKKGKGKGDSSKEGGKANVATKTKEAEENPWTPAEWKHWCEVGMWEETEGTFSYGATNLATKKKTVSFDDQETTRVFFTNRAPKDHGWGFLLNSVKSELQQLAFQTTTDYRALAPVDRKKNWRNQTWIDIGKNPTYVILDLG